MQPDRAVLDIAFILAYLIIDITQAEQVIGFHIPAVHTEARPAEHGQVEVPIVSGQAERHIACLSQSPNGLFFSPTNGKSHHRPACQVETYAGLVVGKMITDKWRQVDIPNVVSYLADAVIDLSDDITTLVKCYEGGEVEGAFKFCIQLQPEMRTGSKGMVLGNPGVFDPGGGHIHTGPECKTGLSDRTKSAKAAG